MKGDPSDVVKVSSPLLYELERMVQAALAGVPPVELLMMVQAGLTASKFSMSMLSMPELEVADEVRDKEEPAQISVVEIADVNPVGKALTLARTGTRDEEQPEAAS